MDTRARRRGETLERAIHQATLDELVATGYARLTMDAVTRRARTGKAALYRRWPSKQELVLDALLHVMPPPPRPATSGPLREELLAALAGIADALSGRTTFPGLDVLAEVLRVPQLRTAFTTRVIEPRLRAIMDLLQRAAERGEIDPTRVDELVARAGPALVVETFLLTASPPAERELARIVDRVVVPLVSPGSAARN